MGDRAADRQVAVGRSGGAPDPAGRRIARVLIPGVNALVRDNGAGGDLTLRQSRDRHAGLEGGAGRISRLQRAVIKRAVLLRRNSGIVGEQRGGVVAGPACDGQWLSRADIHGHSRRAGDELRILPLVLRAAFIFRGDVGAERIFRRFLQANVDGEVDMVARHRLLCVDRTGDRAARCARHAGFAIRSVQIVLKGGFRAADADLRVQRIAARKVVLRLLAADRTGIAQNMGGIRGIVVADIAVGHIKAADIVFQQVGDQLHADILRKHIVRCTKAGNIAGVQLVTDTGDNARFLRGVAVADIITVTHIGHQLHRARVRVQPTLIQIGRQRFALDVGHLGVFKRRAHRDRQRIGVGFAKGCDGVCQKQDCRIGLRPVRVVLPEQILRVDHKIIADAALRQHPSIAVHQTAARRADARGGDDAVPALLIIRLSLYDLQLIERDDGNHDEGQHDRPHCGQPRGWNEFVHQSFLSKEKSGGAVRCGAASSGWRERAAQFWQNGMRKTQAPFYGLQALWQKICHWPPLR